MLLMNVLERLILTIVSDEVEKSFHIEFRHFPFALSLSVCSFPIVGAH